MTAERYVLLGLRLGRHVDGLVDAYFGPDELAAQVEAEEPTPILELVEEADALVGATGDGWLRDQLDALRAYAGVLAGEPISYADEVERCYGVRPVRARRGGLRRGARAARPPLARRRLARRAAARLEAAACGAGRAVGAGAARRRRRPAGPGSATSSACPRARA